VLSAVVVGNGDSFGRGLGDDRPGGQPPS